MKNTIKYYTLKNIDQSKEYQNLNDDQKRSLRVVGSVLPFRVNNYVLENLIDWSNIPNDPIFQLTFMQDGMINENQFNRVASALENPMSTQSDISSEIFKVRKELNPHPSGQLSSNVPFNGEKEVEGVQHKYKETVLVFPSNGQLCHSYCTFCFRWPQFIGDKDLKFSTDAELSYLSYLSENKEVTDVLFTGGDPMIMNATLLRKYIQPLLSPEYSHIQSIRIGSKSLTYWPYRFVSDRDSSEVLNLFEEIVKSGKHLSFMAHINHPQEMRTPIFKEAVSSIRSTGAVIRSQAPLLKFINDRPEDWSTMWKEQVNMGIIPYYMFVERDTGPQGYFGVPLIEAYEIFQKAIQNVSGLARTVRGPSMSATQGKVCINGVTKINGEKAFVLTYLQARNPKIVNRPFFAKFDSEAMWFSELRPFFPEDEIYFLHFLQAKESTSNVDLKSSPRGNPINIDSV